MSTLAGIALVVLAGLAVATCIALLPDPRPIRRRRNPAPDPARPEQLVAIERLLTTSRTSATHTHAYLRPRLVEIAAYRLALRGQTLDRIPPGAGRELFGERLWDLIAPDRSFPEDRHGPGVTPHELRAMLEVLECL